jgi:hypothetical protein
MPRFVILAHDHPFPHWDFMLEEGEALRSWRLRELPRPGLTLAAEPLPNHRRAYLDYEGPVSGGRGTVVQVDAGNYCILKSDATGLVLQLDNGRNRMVATLRIDADAQLWTFEATEQES